MGYNVSVILPCYNGARWISRAIKSILVQTYDNFELVIIDDGSTDSSKEIFAPYLCDGRVRYIYQENRGFSGAINRGIKESKGDLIGFIGQDDIWIPNKLELQIKYFSKRRDIDLVYSNYYSIDSEERIIGVVKAMVPDFSSKQELITQLFLNNFIGFETVMVRRKCFDEVGFLDERMMAFSDHDMWLRIAGSFNIGYLDLPLVKKRDSEFQLSKARAETALRDEFLIAKKAIEHCPFLKRVERKKFASLYYALGIALLQKGDYQKAKKEFIKVIMYQPWALKTVAVYFAPTLYNHILNHYKRIDPEIHVGLKWLES